MTTQTEARTYSRIADHFIAGDPYLFTRNRHQYRVNWSWYHPTEDQKTIESLWRMEQRVGTNWVLIHQERGLDSVGGCCRKAAEFIASYF